MDQRPHACPACAAQTNLPTFCAGCWEAKEEAYRTLPRNRHSYADVLTTWLDTLEKRAAANGIPVEECRRRLWDVFFRPSYGALKRDAEELT